MPLEQRSLVGSAAEAVIALADYDCRVETDYEARFLDVQLDLERQLVEANRDQLNKLMAATWQ
jgi:hypothetical protein